MSREGLEKKKKKKEDEIDKNLKNSGLIIRPLDDN